MTFRDCQRPCHRPRPLTALTRCLLLRGWDNGWISLDPTANKLTMFQFSIYCRCCCSSVDAAVTTPQLHHYYHYLFRYIHYSVLLHYWKRKSEQKWEYESVGDLSYGHQRAATATPRNTSLSNLDYSVIPPYIYCVFSRRSLRFLLPWARLFLCSNEYSWALWEIRSRTAMTRFPGRLRIIHLPQVRNHFNIWTLRHDPYCISSAYPRTSCHCSRQSTPLLMPFKHMTQHFQCCRIRMCLNLCVFMYAYVFPNGKKRKQYTNSSSVPMPRHLLKQSKRTDINIGLVCPTPAYTQPVLPNQCPTAGARQPFPAGEQWQGNDF